MTASLSAQQAAIRSRRCWTLQSATGRVDVEVEAGDETLLGAVLEPLAAALGVAEPQLWSGSEQVPDEVPLTAPELAHGSVLGIGRPVAGCPTGRSSALELHVVGGPQAGRTAPLVQGTHVLGRGAGADLVLDDPDVSRRHAVVHVGGAGISVADLGSTNGTRLDGEELGTAPRTWRPGTALRLGASTLTVAGPDTSPATTAPAPGGRTRLTPSPRVSVPHPEVEVTLPAAPDALHPRRLAWAAVALPAVGGIVMSVLLRTPTFLFLALLSPLVAIAGWLSDRLSGRRARRRETADHDLAVAAVERRLDEAVRAYRRAFGRAHPDPATLTTAARRRSSLLWSRTADDADALTLRLGSGAGPAGVTRVEGDGRRHQVEAADLPVVVDLRRVGGLGIVGPRPRTLGALAALITQVAVLHPPGEVDLALVTDDERAVDWRWTRWLPHLPPERIWMAPSSTPGADARLHAALAGRRAAVASGATAPWLVVLVDRPLDRILAADLRDSRDARVLTLCTAAAEASLPLPGGALLRVTGETGHAGALSRDGAPDAVALTIDTLDPAAGAQLVRDLAALSPATAVRSLPDAVRLLDLPGPGLRLGGDGAVQGQWSRTRDRLLTTLGCTSEGPLVLDLCRSGPHALVAGTTGSGKSELLQTLIAGLALNHPPDRCSFLLVDYKGGAAFAEAAALPHTVGLLTDLDGQTTARALRSLAAELGRREALLARHGAADVTDLPPEAEIARLVIVVDEFATLAEELPGFVPGLVGIAQRGRSLGVHLVLATQRPGGVVSPEIRANCTLRICLRTTDEADSRDVLGSAAAAHLPLDRPGRGYLRVGSGAPTAMQVARVSTCPENEAGPRVRRWVWPPVADLPGPDAPPPGRSDLAGLAAATRELAARTGLRAPHRPWHPALPDQVRPGELWRDRPGTGPLRIGLLDRPDHQAQEPLLLDLRDAGCWLAVGGPRSGRTTLLRTVLGEAVHAVPSDRLHVHVLDHGGELATEAAGLPHLGTCIGPDDALRTARLVDRLSHEVAARRGLGPPEKLPRLLLLIDGMDSVMAQLDESDPGHGSAALLRLLRDGAAAGLTSVVTTDRAVPGGRLAAVARQRLVLPLGDTAEYAVAGIRPDAVPSRRPPGRALVGEEALECQLALPRPLPRPAQPATGPASPDGRLRIVELPPDPEVPLPPRSDGPVTGEVSPPGLDLVVGPGGDEGGPVSADLLRTGGLLIVGPQGSGRTATLDAFSAHLVAAGAAVLRIGHPTTRPSGATPGDGEWLDPADATGLSAWLGERRDTLAVLVADDVGTALDWPTLTGEVTVRNNATLAVLAAGTPADLAGHYQGPVATLRRRRTGLLLCPGPGDADILGIRLPRTPVPKRPGSGWLVIAGTPTRVQVARRRAESRASSTPAPTSGNE